MGGDSVDLQPTCLKELVDTAKGAAAVGRFAGQGHRWIQEFRILLARSQVVQELVRDVSFELAEAARVLQVDPFEPAKILHIDEENQDASLIRPSISAPMIGLAQLATTWQVVEESGIGGLYQLRMIFARGLVGHSQGIMSAVALASSRSRTDLLKAITTAVMILWLLGMHAEAVEGKMALIEGPQLGREQLESIVRSHADLHVVGRNAERTFVLSGRPAALETMRAAVENENHECFAGGRFRMLRIEAPFHSPLLADAVPKIAADAARLDLGFGPTSLPVFHGSGKQLEPGATVSRLVSLVCTEEIDWPGTMAAIGECPYTVEFGPGAPLPLPTGTRIPALAALKEVVASNTSGLPIASGGQLAAAEPNSVIPRRRQPVPNFSLTEIISRMVEALAQILECSAGGIDHETPFFDLGLRSNDLARFAGVLSDTFGGAAVAAHELFDYPSVVQLATRLEKRLVSAGPMVPLAADEDEYENHGPDPEDVKGCVLWVFATALGVDREDVELDVPFAQFGLDLDDLDRIACALSEKVHMQVDLAELEDFNTVARLGRRLLQKRSGFANFGAAWALLPPARIDPDSVEKMVVERQMTLDVVLHVQKKLRKRLSQSDVQQDLERLSAACFPDGEAYLAALHSRVMDEEEKIYRCMGFLNQDTSALRRKALRITSENIKTSPELKMHSKKLVELTWPSDTSRWKW